MAHNEENICWFHQNLTRDQADEILKKDDFSDGYFLVRESHSSDGDFALSVRHLSDVFHYQIRRHGEDAFFSIDDQQPIHGLDSLVEHYKTATASGLVTKLTTFVRGVAPPPDSRSHGRTNLLHRATKEGDYTVVSELLKCGYRNFDAKNQDGLTAVHLACRYGNDQLLAKLIASGANVNCRDSDGNTPLHYAFASNTVPIIKLLVGAKANLQARNKTTGCVPLHDAARQGNLPAVRELLACGAPLRPRSDDGELPIDFAREGAHQDVAAYLDAFKEADPLTYMYQWYHGTLNRTESEKHLKQFATAQLAKEVEFSASGVFLVRFSSKSGDFVLTMLADDHPKHFIIQKYLKFLFIDEGPYLPSLEHLVQHYTLFSDGLPVNLRIPVPPKPKPPLPLFSTMPRDARVKSSAGFDNEMSPVSPPPPVPTDPKPSQSLSLPPKEQQRTSPKPKSESSNNFLTLTSKKKNIIIDGMRSLKKSRKSKTDNTLSVAATAAPSLADVSMSLQNLSFTSELYNVPTNNTAVQQTPPQLSPRHDSALSPEYFTESDRLASDELVKEEDVYFVDVPVVVAEPVTPSNYLPTQIVARFSDEASAQLQNATNNNPALPPQLPTRIDRQFSTVSLTSTASDRFFRQQLSVDSAHPLAQQSATGDVPNYFIPSQSLQQAGILGEGEFGSVFSGTLKWSFDGQTTELVDVAIKTLHDEHCKTDRAAFLREASVMIKLAHHCIVRLVGISRGPPLMMVQELVGLGSMLTYILEKPQHISVHYEIKLWAAQIACGMDYLESKHFVHRDLAARNILLASRHQAKISDFGLSRALAADNNYYQASQGGKWPIKWYAPESFNYGTFSHASDVWSFGVTLWEMFSFGLVPFGDMKGVDVIKVIEAGERLTIPAKCPENVFKCMECCWKYKPRERPTFQYLTRFFASDPDYQNVLEMISREQIG